MMTSSPWDAAPAGRRRGVCLAISAPSGAGKTTIGRMLLKMEPALWSSVSVTTRAPRRGEQEGIHYLYRDQPAFRRMVDEGSFLEWAQVFGQSYGTPRKPVESALMAGQDVLFDIDWQGWRQLRAALPNDCVGVFVLPPSIEALDMRLRKRSGDSLPEIERRMAAAREELRHWAEFDHVVVNDDLPVCVDEVRAVLHAARSRIGRQGGAAEFVRSLLRDAPAGNEADTLK